MVRPPPEPGPPWLVVQGLRARRGKVEVLKGVDLSVGDGVTALIGAQGAGKTTLVRILLGIDSPSGGKATVGGRDARRDPIGVRQRVGYVPEELAFTPGMTGIQLSRLVESLYPGWEARTFYDLLARLGVPARQRIEDLLLGVRARLALGAALAFGPEALVVDMPQGLDAPGRKDLLLGLAEERGATPTLVATSEPRDLESLADTVIVLAGGRRVYSGPKAALVSETRRVDLRAGAQRPTLPEGARRIRWLPRADGGRLWVHLARGDAEGALSKLEGVRAVVPVDFEEACLARIKGTETDSETPSRTA